MNKFRRVAPGDLEALQMENELLSYEVLHLRARLKDADRDWQQRIRAVEMTAKKQKAKDARRIVELERMNRINEELQQAKNDIRWLVNRLDKSVLGPVLRHRPGFRALLARHMTDSKS